MICFCYFWKKKCFFLFWACCHTDLFCLSCAQKCQFLEVLPIFVKNYWIVIKVSTIIWISSFEMEVEFLTKKLVILEFKGWICMPKREHMWNKEKLFLFHFRNSVHSWDNQILTFQIFKCHDFIKCLMPKHETWNLFSWITYDMWPVYVTLQKEGKTQIQKFEYLENGKSFLDEIKTFLIVFEGLSFGEK